MPENEDTKLPKKPQIQSCITQFFKNTKKMSLKKGSKKGSDTFDTGARKKLILCSGLNNKRKISGSVMTFERVYPSHQLNVDNKLKCTVSFFNQMLEARFA